MGVLNEGYHNIAWLLEGKALSYTKFYLWGWENDQVFLISKPLKMMQTVSKAALIIPPALGIMIPSFGTL